MITYSELKTLTEKLPYYSKKLENEMPKIFGVDVRGQDLFLRQTRSFLFAPDFVEIPNMTRKILIPDIGSNQNFVTAKIAVGFRLSAKGSNKLTFRCDIRDLKRSNSIEKDFNDPFWTKDYNEYLLLFNRMTSKSNHFFDIVYFSEALSPLSDPSIITERELSMTMDFMNNHSFLGTGVLKGISKLSYKEKNYDFDKKTGYIPKFWTLRDFSNWLLVSKRFPTLKEARTFQRELQIKKNQLFNSTPGVLCHDRF